MMIEFVSKTTAVMQSLSLSFFYSRFQTLNPLTNLHNFSNVPTFVLSSEQALLDVLCNLLSSDKLRVSLKPAIEKHSATSFTLPLTMVKASKQIRRYWSQATEKKINHVFGPEMYNESKATTGEQLNERERSPCVNSKGMKADSGKRRQQKSIDITRDARKEKISRL